MKILISHWNNTLLEIERELRKKHTMLNGIENLKKCDVLVIWNEAELSGRPLVREAKKLGIPVVLIQHGRRGTSRIHPPFNEEVLADKVCVWGEGDRQRHLRAGTPEEKIVITGTPIFKSLKTRVEHEGKNVVYSPEHWDKEIDENICVATILRRIEGINVTTKILDGEHDPMLYPNPIGSDRQKLGHLDVCADVLSKADLVVGIADGTFELMAQMLDIPVIIPDIWKPKQCAGDDRYLTYEREYSEAVTLLKDVSKLEDTIKYQLKHPEILIEERKIVSLADGGDRTGDPVANIIKVIEDLYANRPARRKNSSR